MKIKTTHPQLIPGYAPKQSVYESIRSPYTGALVGEVEKTDREGLSHALAAANRLFKDRKRHLPPYERARILRRLSGLIDENREALAMLIAQEGGKPLVDARIEVTRAAETVRLAAEETTRIHGDEIPMGGSMAAYGRLAFTIREPIGVVAALSAFNHPLNLIAHQVAPAVAAGCPVLVKPALKTPISCMVFIELLREAGLPPEFAIPVLCDHEITEALSASPDIAFLSFIGSARVGWSLRSKLAPGVRCALEHGGVAPVIVDESADLDRAIPLIVKGGFYHAGQVCVSVQRVFVHRQVKQALVDRLSQAVTALRVGDPTRDDTEVGPLIRESEVGRVDAWIREAIAAGAMLVCGGTPLNHQCYAPTVLIDVPLTTRLMTEEIFGPVIALHDIGTLDEAITKSNAIPWAFQAAIFTQDIDRALIAAKALNASAVMVNDHTAFRTDWMPFGGRGPSGLGVGGVPASVREMMQEKLVVFNAK